MSFEANPEANPEGHGKCKAPSTKFLLRSDFSLPKLDRLQQDTKSRICASFGGDPTKRLIAETRRDMRRNTSRSALKMTLRNRWLENCPGLEALVAACDRSGIGFVSFRDVESVFQKRGLHLLLGDLEQVFSDTDRRRGFFPVETGAFGAGTLLPERERRRRRRKCNPTNGLPVVCVQISELGATGYFQPNEVEVEGRKRPEEVVDQLQGIWQKLADRGKPRRDTVFDWGAVDDDNDTGYAHEDDEGDKLAKEATMAAAGAGAGAADKAADKAAGAAQKETKATLHLPAVKGSADKDADTAQARWQENRRRRKGASGRNAASAQLKLAKPQPRARAVSPPLVEPEQPPQPRRRNKVQMEVERQCEELVKEAMERYKRAQAGEAVDEAEAEDPAKESAKESNRVRSKPSPEAVKRFRATQQLEMLWSLRQRIDDDDIEQLAAKHERQAAQFSNPDQPTDSRTEDPARNCRTGAKSKRQ
jgi:hypothetical protein